MVVSAFCLRGLVEAVVEAEFLTSTVAWLGLCVYASGLCVYVCVCARVCACACVYVLGPLEGFNMDTHTHAHTRTHARTCDHARARTHTHTHHVEQDASC